MEHTQQIQSMADPVVVNSGAGATTDAEVSDAGVIEESPRIEYPVFHCGIRNTGNTCFMNAPLQILARIRRFAQWFRMRGYLTIDGWSSRPKHVVDMCEQFQDMMDALRSPGTNAVTPNGFRGVFVESAIAENMGWMIQGQNDAQEFTSMILNLLHKGCSQNLSEDSSVKKALVRKFPDVLGSFTENLREVLEQMAETNWWTHYSKEYNPIMTNMFHGQILTIISSRETEERSFRFEPFITLDLAVPDIDTGCITIQDCLDSHFANEPMRGDSRWSSPSKGKVNAIRASRIWKLPDVLVMSIKRCSNTGQKINTKVSYSLDSLDMSAYCTGPAKESGDDCKYTLVGVVIHVGVMFGGHYFTFVRNPGGQWMIINDMRVGLLKPEQVIDGVGAYMLVYQRESIIREDDAEEIKWYEKWKEERREIKAKREQQRLQEQQAREQEQQGDAQAQARPEEVDDMADADDDTTKLVRFDTSAITPSVEAMETYRRLSSINFEGKHTSAPGLDYTGFTPIHELSHFGEYSEDDMDGVYEGTDDVLEQDDSTINDITMNDIQDYLKSHPLQKRK
jgi:ubiquitin C-terminal hydrolase